MAVSHGSTGDVMTPNQSKLLKIIWMTIASTQLPFSCFLPCNKPALLLLLFNRFVHITFVSFVVFSLEKKTLILDWYFNFFSAQHGPLPVRRKNLCSWWGVRLKLNNSSVHHCLQDSQQYLDTWKGGCKERGKEWKDKIQEWLKYCFRHNSSASCQPDEKTNQVCFLSQEQGKGHVCQLASVASVSARVRPSASLGGNACYNIYIKTYVYTVGN